LKKNGGIVGEEAQPAHSIDMTTAAPFWAQLQKPKKFGLNGGGRTGLKLV